MKITIILLVLFALTISADTRIQSDWNSGPGVYGPVDKWTDVFYQADGICYTAMYDTLLLGMTISTQMVLPPGSGWGIGLLSADFDCDGDVDLSCFLDTQLIYEQQLFIIENVDGTGTDWNLHRVSDVPFSTNNHTATGDVNGDGYPDILAGEMSDTGQLRLYINSGGTSPWNEYVMNDKYKGFRLVDIADVDGDGIDEVAASENFDNGLFFWSFLGFKEDGCLESSVLDTGYDLINWDSFSWSADEPSGTSVCFQIRGSDDYNQMGDWSDTLYPSGSGIGGILQSQDRYFQYRAILSTTDIWNSACLDEVMVSFNPLSVDPGPVNENLFTISSNPSGSVPIFDITLAESCNVDLQLFDISGRMVSTVFMGDLPAGMHSLYSGELMTGIYIARLSLNGEISTLSFIVMGE